MWRWMQANERLGQKSVYSVWFRCASNDFIEQGLPNYDPVVKSIPQPVFVNNVLLEHSKANLLLFCQWLLQCSMIELSSCNRNYMALKS